MTQNQSGKQLFEWVKALERLPEKSSMETIWRFTDGSGAGYWYEKGYGFKLDSGWLRRDMYNQIEWLSPAQPSTGKPKDEWKVVPHFYQIADTGDYDGHYEITNGKVSLQTKDDEDEHIQKLVDFLNSNDDFNLFDNKKDEASFAWNEVSKLQTKLEQLECSTGKQLPTDEEIELIDPFNLSKEMPVISFHEYYDQTQYFLSNLQKAYSKGFYKRPLKDEDFPSEEVCAKCTGCGTFEFGQVGREEQCFKGNPIEGEDCFSNEFDPALVFEEMENIEDLFGMVGIPVRLRSYEGKGDDKKDVKC